MDMLKTVYPYKTPLCGVINTFSASNFFIHNFNMSIIYLQSVEKIQWKLYEEFSQSMHNQPLFTMCNHRKMAKLQAL